MKSDKKTPNIGVFLSLYFGQIEGEYLKIELILKCEIVYRLQKACDK